MFVFVEKIIVFVVPGLENIAGKLHVGAPRTHCTVPILIPGTDIVPILKTPIPDLPRHATKVPVADGLKSVIA
jgi:hypothetical protein